MNNKQLKNLIINQADKISIPDHKNDILNKVTFTPATQVEEVLTTDNNVTIKNQNSNKNKFRLAMVAFSTCLIILIITLAIILPNKSPSLNTLTFGKSEKVLSNELFALCNVVSGSTGESTSNGTLPFISNDKDGDVLTNGFILYKSTNTPSPSQTECNQIASDVNDYLLTCEAFLGCNDISVTYTENLDTQYNSYKYKMTVNYKDSSQVLVNYVAYFNQQANGKITKIIGVCIIDGKEYEIKGNQTTKADEIESELLIYGENSYVKIENETEFNENEYEIEYVKDGVTVKGVSIEISTENGKKQTEIEVTLNGNTTCYEFEYVSPTVINCEFEKNGEEQEIIITVFNNYYLYQFKNGIICKIDRVLTDQNS